jgi:hypothetical protein
MAYVVLSPRFKVHNKEERNPMSRKCKWGRMSRNVLATVALAGLVVGGLAPATRAAAITFDPTGAPGGGVSGVTGFTYNTGDVDIQNAITPGTPPVNNSTGLTAYYQSVLTTVNAGSNTVNAGTNFGFGGTSNYQFTVVAGFSEQFAGAPVFGPAPGGGQEVTTTLQLGGGTTNFFEIFANPTNTNPSSTYANFAAGTGFGAQTGSVLVLAGTISTSGFVSQFNELGTGTNITNFVPTTQTFDPNAPANGDTKYQGMNSVIGNGSTNLSVTVNTSFLNPTFFPNGGVLPTSLVFQTTSSLPFGVQVPSALFYNSTSVATGNGSTGTPVSPNLGGSTGTNGITGPDFMFQANSSNSFAVPEPGSITMALTAMGLVSLAGGLKAAHRRRSKTSAV